MKTLLTAAATLALFATPVLAATAVPATAPATTSAANAPRQGVFEKADANHDGVVTRDEFVTSEGQYFDSVDANHDGKLSQDEIKAVRDKARAKRMAWKEQHAGAAAGAK